MLLERSQIEEIARFNVGESFFYMEGWYRPRSVKIPEENSAKVKLGVETSLTGEELTRLLQTKSWYLEAQRSLLTSAISEHSYLCQLYRQSIEALKREFKQVDNAIAELEVSFTLLVQDTFHTLAAALKFTEELDEFDERVNFDRLTVADDSTLAIILQLQTQIRDKFNSFDCQVQAVEQLYNNLGRSQYQQQWQRWQRQLENLRRQVQQLDNIFNSNASNELRKQWQEVESDRQNAENKDTKLERNLKQLKKIGSCAREQIEKRIANVLGMAKTTKIARALRLNRFPSVCDR